MTFLGRRLRLKLFAAIVAGLAATCAADEPAKSPTSKLSNDWSTTVRLPPYSWPKEDFPSGTCRAWAEQGWLIVERRTDQNELEWKIVLANEGNEKNEGKFAERGCATHLSFFAFFVAFCSKPSRLSKMIGYESTQP